MDKKKRSKSKTRKVQTLAEMHTALRGRDENWTFPTMADLGAWDKIEKHTVRKYQKQFSVATFRQLKIEIAEAFDLKLYRMGNMPISEFADLCDREFGKRPKRRTRKRRKPGHPANSDAERDARISDAWESCGCRTYRQGTVVLQDRFDGLTETDLKKALDRHRKRKSQDIGS